MLVIPAIDLKEGKAVRLFKGDYLKKTIYSDRPMLLAKGFEKMGAKYLHIIDLDGAKDGTCLNFETIKEIRQNIDIPIEIGGGIRNSQTVSLYLNELKIDRVILGTAAVEDKEFLEKIIKEYGPEKIVVSVDVKDGFVSTSGWTKTSEVEYTEFIKYLETIGVKYIVVTDISKDGTLSGPNFDMYKKIKEISNINFVVSGGIKNEENIYDVSKLDYYGCIVGKAYYEGKVNLEEVIKCLQEE